MKTSFSSSRCLSLILFSSVLLCACTATKSPDRDNIVTQALPSTTAIPQSWQSLAAKPGEIDSGWLSHFKDPQLESLVQEALNNNLSLRAATANVTKAEALAVQAGAALKPAVGLGGSTRSTESGRGNLLDTDAMAISVSWELDLWGKLRARAQSGEEAYFATVAEYEFARLSLVGQVTKTWLLATEIHQQQLLAEETIVIFKQMLQYAKNRRDVGKVTSLDVHLAAADLASAESALRTIKNTQLQVTRSLEILLGRYPSSEIQARKEFLPLPDSIPSGVPSDLLERRLDLISAERLVAAAFQRTEEAKAAKLPSFSLTASAGQSSSDLVSLLGLDKNYFNVGANFIAPLYSGGALDAQVEIQTANQEQALANYGQTALKAFSEVESALTNERVLGEQEDLIRVSVKENKDALRITKNQYNVGKIDLFTVLQIQARLNSARSELIRILNARLTQRVDLHMALGGDFE